MSTERKNIGKMSAHPRAEFSLQASDFAQEIITEPAVANDDRYIVGQLHSVLSTAAGLGTSLRKETAEQRWQRYIDEWQASSHPNPNRMLTINLDKVALDAHIAAGGTISKFKIPVLDYMRKICRRTGQPWLAAWAIEVRNHPHIHIVIYLPESSDFEAQLWRWLSKRFPIPTLSRTERASRLSTYNSGAPVHISNIEDSEFYSKTGRSGIDGLADYLAKAIEVNSNRRRGRPIGRIVGRTQELKGRSNGR